MVTRVGIVGASGYSGAVLARLIASHPNSKLTFLTSDRHEGAHVRDRLGGFFSPDLTFSPNKAALDLAKTADVIFLATSAEVSAPLAPQVAESGKLTIDLSGAFRLRDSADYPTWYGFAHPSPSHLASAFYGLPELFGAAPKDTRLIANPGCYATATLLALTPMLESDLVEAGGIVVDGKSGVSGAGRRATEDYSFVETHDDLRAYKILRHQHTPEIVNALGRKTKSVLSSFAFVPHLVPISRGLLVTCYARTRPGVDAKHLRDRLVDAYGSCAFVRVVDASEVSIHAAAGTNFAHVGATANDGMAVIVCSIDNLLKGAAGQALQNMNLALGISETLGLAELSRIAP